MHTEIGNSDLRVIILKADRIYAQAIRRVAATATFVICQRLAQAKTAIAEGKCDLLLTGVEMIDGDIFEMLTDCLRAPRRVGRVLVVTGRRQPQVLATLRAIGVDGVFDPSTEEPEALTTAITQTLDGMPYWSESIQIFSWRSGGDEGSIFARLTSHERLVLAVIGDGSDDKAAAQRLGVTARAVKATRGKLYEKLGIHQKGDLIRLASQLGFVVITDRNVIRPGFSQLRAARAERANARKQTERSHLQVS